MNILHVFRAPLGGLFRHVLDLTRAQAERGHQVGIVCDADTGGERADTVFAGLTPLLGLGIHRFPMRRNPHWTDVAALRGLQEVARRTAADVIHGHGSKGGLYARLPNVMGRKGAVRAYTPHGGSLNYYPGTTLHRVYMATERLLERGTDVFLFESRFIGERYTTFVGETDKLVRIVLNGVHPAEFEPVSRAGITHDLLYIGEFRFAKGIDNLIAAMAMLKATRVAPVRLLLVGSGPDEAELRRQIAELGLADQVMLSPPLAARAAFERARIMVVPSRFESMPYVVLEAAAAHMPMISTDVGGIPEIFGSEAHRLIAADDVSALASAIAAALDTPPDVLGADAERLVRGMGRRFDVATMADDVLAAYAAGRAARG
jgi:glycosyltransferase involved in cell wall biosynthesis